DELRRPHLVLADTGTVNRVGANLLGQGLDDELRGHLLVRGVLIAAREVFLHLPQVLTPLGGIRTRKTVGIDRLVQRREDLLRVTDNRHLDLANLADFRGGDVRVYDLGLRGEARQPSCASVVETGT